MIYFTAIRTYTHRFVPLKRMVAFRSLSTTRQQASSYCYGDQLRVLLEVTRVHDNATRFVLNVACAAISRYTLSAICLGTDFYGKCTRQRPCGDISVII